jgi:RecJ-like exonuclease
MAAEREAVKCLRCRGTGRVPYRRDCGMCYRCHGTGSHPPVVVKPTKAPPPMRRVGVKPPAPGEELLF